MENLIGTSNNLLEINLSTNTITNSKINSKDREMYLGGKGLGLLGKAFPIITAVQSIGSAVSGWNNSKDMFDTKFFRDDLVQEADAVGFVRIDAATRVDQICCAGIANDSGQEETHSRVRREAAL